MILRSMIIPRKAIILLIGLFAVIFGLTAVNLGLRVNLFHESAPIEVNAGVTKIQDSKKLKESFQDAFFVDYRLSRDQARSKRIEFLKEIACNPASVSEAREQAQKDLLELLKLIEKEAQLEKLIMAYGFRESVVLLEQETATVVVASNHFSLEDKNRLAALVAKVAGLKIESVLLLSKSS